MGLTRWCNFYSYYDTYCYEVKMLGYWRWIIISLHVIGVPNDNYHLENMFMLLCSFRFVCSIFSVCPHFGIAGHFHIYLYTSLWHAYGSMYFCFDITLMTYASQMTHSNGYSWKPCIVIQISVFMFIGSYLKPIIRRSVTWNYVPVCWCIYAPLGLK